MVNLNKLSKEAYDNAERRGLPLDNRSIDKHLQEEVKELIDSKPMKNPNALTKIANIRDDKEFLAEYKKEMKDSTTDELADVIINSLTKARALGIDIETAVMIKQRVNFARED